MRILASLDTPLVLPLHTVFEIDFSAIFPADMPTTIASLFFSDSNGVSNYTRFYSTVAATDEPAVYRFVPNPAPTTLVLPEGSIGFTIYDGGYNLLPFLPVSFGEQVPGTTHDWRGTAGGDVFVYDGNDAAMARVHTVDASGGNDSISLTNAAGIVLGRGGNDTLIGWDGNDGLYGGGGDDRLEGRGGDDVLHALAGNDALFGGLGNDHLYAHSGNNLLTGGEGHDAFTSGTGNDTIRGEAGDDRVFLRVVMQDAPSATTTFFGGLGNDSVNADFFSSVEIAQATGANGKMALLEIHGGEGDDNLQAGQAVGGNIYGGEGNDALAAFYLDPSQEGNAPMRLYGGNGRDSFTVGDGVQAYGGADGDYLTGNEGAALYGDTGNDVISINAGEGETQSSLYGGDGDDEMDAGNGDDLLFGGNGNDSMTAGEGLTSLYGGAGDDSLVGSADADWLSGGSGNDTLTASDGRFGYTTEERLVYADQLFGGAGDDMLNTNRGGHVLRGGEGNDRLNAIRAFYDDTNPAVLFGGSGDDVFTGTGLVTATGGEGADVFVVDVTGSANALAGYTLMTVRDFDFATDRFAFLSDVGYLNADGSSYYPIGWELIVDISGTGTEVYIENAGFGERIDLFFFEPPLVS